jgi:putative DNA-invertase from lambdoid prophage Rac
MNKPFRVGLYARCSTADQQSLPMQIAEMREYAERQGWTVTECVEDVASGAKRRPKREALEKLAKQRKLDGIIVWKLDRWGRSIRDLVVSLPDLTEAGVRFVSVTDALDLSTPSGRCMVNMLGVFAEFERDTIRERVRSGLAEARKKGKVLGRHRTADAKAPEIWKLYEEGVSKNQIAQRLKVGHDVVHRTLQTV